MAGVSSYREATSRTHLGHCVWVGVVVEEQAQALGVAMVSGGVRRGGPNLRAAGARRVELMRTRRSRTTSSKWKRGAWH